jgi:hypothetical protein
MKRPNKLAIALNSWLTFEQMCKRSPLFSESYLSFPIGQFLSSRYGAALVAEHPHPVLAPRRTGRGDKPRIDFAVLREDRTVEVAIETKWLSSSTTLQRDIIRDLIRLELVSNAHKCEAWLVLAGKASAFTELVNSRSFGGHPLHVGSDPILPYGSSRQGRLRLNPPSKFRAEMLRAAIEPFMGVELTDCIHVTRFGPYPEQAEPGGYITYLWRVSRREKTRFLPESVYSAA